MKICTYDGGRVGVVDGHSVVDLTDLAPPREPHPTLWVARQGIALVDEIGRRRARARPLADVALDSPLPRPGKVVAAPVNYKAHVEEMLASGQAHGHTLTDIRKAGMFLKASSSVIGPSRPVRQRFLDRRTDHEIELCAVIGRSASNVSADDALGCVAGYCLGLDITVRGPEDRSFRKSIDTYCVLGPWLVTADEAGAPDAIELELQVDGQVRQHASTADMVLDVAQLIAFTSSFYTLEPGDVLMTGTPQGVGPIRPGNVLLARGTGLGSMTVRVEAA